jgi:hypothetical protein
MASALSRGSCGWAGFVCVITLVTFACDFWVVSLVVIYSFPFSVGWIAGVEAFWICPLVDGQLGSRVMGWSSATCSGDSTICSGDSVRSIRLNVGVGVIVCWWVR